VDVAWGVRALVLALAGGDGVAGTGGPGTIGGSNKQIGFLREFLQAAMRPEGSYGMTIALPRSCTGGQVWKLRRLSVTHLRQCDLLNN
jgi:hypothetical protein